MQAQDENLTNAVATASYYDELWRSASQVLDYTELYRVRFITDSITRFVNIPRPAILDLGCGRGWMAPFLSKFGTVVAVDFSADAIQRAQLEYGEHGTFTLADPGSPRLGLSPDSVFDVVVCSEVIEHVPRPIEFVRLIKSLLRSEGWCILTTPNGNVWEQFRADRRFNAALQPVENWLRPAELRRVFQQEGFWIAHQEGLPHHSFRPGDPLGLQRRQVHRTFRALGLANLYGRLILRQALYQALVARRLDPPHSLVS